MQVDYENARISSWNPKNAFIYSAVVATVVVVMVVKAIVETAISYSMHLAFSRTYTQNFPLYQHIPNGFEPPLILN